MQIQTHSTVGAARLRRRPELTEVARLDQQLAAGNGDSVDLNTEAAAAGKKTAMRNFTYEALHCSVFGTLLGLGLSNMSVQGAALGLGTSLYVAWNRSLRKESGKVKIELDGAGRTARYYGSTTAYEKTPQEVRAEMLADGRLGERIEAYSPKPGESPKVKVSPELAAHQKTLSGLAKNRRLVAAFGQKSRYGHETLNFVDSTTAAKLIEAKRPVYLVSGESKDTEHSYKVVAANERQTTMRQIHKSYVEREFEYSLRPLTGPESLQELPPGEGLPEGFNGVYRDQESCALVMATDNQNGFATSGKKSSKVTFDYSRRSRDASVDLGSTDKARVGRVGSVNVRDLITLGGVAGGMMAGMGFFPGNSFAVLAGGALGGMAGRELGWVAQDHMPTFNL